MEPQTKIPRTRPRSASVPLPMEASLLDALNQILGHKMSPSPDITSKLGSNSSVNFPPNGTQPTASSSARPANSHAAGSFKFPTAGSSTGKRRFYFANSSSPGLNPDAIDLDAFRCPTFFANSPTSESSDTEKKDFGATAWKIIDKQTKGDLVVAKELLYEFSRVLYGTENGNHIHMEDRKYIVWKTTDPKCPTFSQYIEQMQILVTFLEQPAAKDKPIVHLVDKLDVSKTCGWDSSWNKDLKVCLKLYIQPLIEWLPDKTLDGSTRTSSLGCAFLR